MVSRISPLCWVIALSAVVALGCGDDDPGDGPVDQGADSTVDGGGADLDLDQTGHDTAGGDADGEGDMGGGDTADPDGMGEDAPDVPEGDGTDALPDMSMGDAPTGDAPPGDATDAIEVAETAVYELTFTATWSAETHPTNAPETPHFSGLIGLTHPPGEPFFDLGDTISDGLELVAETGGKELIRPELEAIIEAGDAYRTIDKGGINPTPGQRADVFRASLEHSAVTIVSMLAPSPDWITGVIDLDLRDESGQWRDRVEVDLLVWDAGTDDGLVFATEDIDTSPRQPVQLLTSDSADTDFVAGAPSVGSFVFVLRVE